MFMSPMENFMFSAVPIFVFIVFSIITITIIAGIISALKKKAHNDRQPVLNVDASIVSRRADTQIRSNHLNDNHHMRHTSSRTTYYVTFQFESGDRLELEVPEEDYGYLVEGDVGQLKFQGTRFLEFTRN